MECYNSPKNRICTKKMFECLYQRRLNIFIYEPGCDPLLLQVEKAPQQPTWNVENMIVNTSVKNILMARIHLMRLKKAALKVACSFSSPNRNSQVFHYPSAFEQTSGFAGRAASGMHLKRASAPGRGKTMMWRECRLFPAGKGFHFHL